MKLLRIMPKRLPLCLALIVLMLLLVACGVPEPALPHAQFAPSPTVQAPLPTPTPHQGPLGKKIVPPTPTTPPVVQPTPTAPPTMPVPFSVTRIDMSVSPSTLTGTVCGSYIVVTYTAIFHTTTSDTTNFVVFGYTVNGGRSGGSSGNSLVFAPGQNSEGFTFTWAGNLPLDHTYPGLGGVLVSSPNVINSPTVKPTGVCS